MRNYGRYPCMDAESYKLFNTFYVVLMKGKSMSPTVGFLLTSHPVLIIDTLLINSNVDKRKNITDSTIKEN